MIYGHGDDFKGELNANFSSNVWYGVDHSALYGHLASILPVIMRYPEADAASLNRALASRLGISTGQVSACNGSVEAFYLIAHAFSGTTSVVVTPTFSEYADACRMHHHDLHFSSREQLSENLHRLKPALVWLCNPNNPDGFCFSVEVLHTLMHTYQDTIFVIDQAYKDFCLMDSLLPENTNHHPNLILVHSLTKRFCIPGLRLGYLIASEKLTRQINCYRIPWSINALAIESGKYILENDQSEMDLPELMQRQDTLQKQINQLGILKALPSQTPYFLVKLKSGTASELKNFLLKDKILVRDATNFRGLKGEHIRLMTLTTSENELLIKQLTEWTRTITH